VWTTCVGVDGVLGRLCSKPGATISRATVACIDHTRRCYHDALAGNGGRRTAARCAGGEQAAAWCNWAADWKPAAAGATRHAGPDAGAPGGAPTSRLSQASSRLRFKSVTLQVRYASSPLRFKSVTQLHCAAARAGAGNPRASVAPAAAGFKSARRRSYAPESAGLVTVTAASVSAAARHWARLRQSTGTRMAASDLSPDPTETPCLAPASPVPR
jgi:hypothetical protein